MIDILTLSATVASDAEIWVLVYEQVREVGSNPRWVTIASREAVADSCSEINLIARYRIPLAAGPDHWRDEPAAPTLVAEVERLRELVRDAYSEGFGDGLSAGDCPVSNWDTSEARAALTGSSQ